jgi:hypothetical protein
MKASNLRRGSNPRWLLFVSFSATILLLVQMSVALAADLSIAHVILWNKLDSSASAGRSLVGDSFQTVGTPVYRAGVTGKAIGVLDDQSSLLMSAEGFFGDEPREGTVSLFLRKGMIAVVPYQTPLPGLFGGHPYGPDRYNAITAWWGDGVTGPSGLNFVLTDSASNTHYATDAAFNTAAIPVTKWVHMLFVWDIRGIRGSTDTLRIYRDGVLVGRCSEPVADLIPSSLPVAFAGSHATSRLPSTPALLYDEIMVFDRAITP